MRCSNLSLVFLIVFLSLTILVSSRSRTEAYTTVISGSGFSIEIADSIGFTTEYTLDIEVISGFWNGTNGTITATTRRGVLAFESTNATTLELSSVDSEHGFRLDTEGVESSSSLGNSTYRTVIATANHIVLVWSWNQPSFIDLWFMFGVGMTGIAMMILGPFYLAKGVVKNAYSSDTAQRLGWAALLFIIGFGLVVCWLWPGGG